MSGIAADESGICFRGGPQSGDTMGVWKLASSKSTQLAEGVDETFTLHVGASRVYGVSTTGTTSDCMQPSTIWSVPKGTGQLLRVAR